MTEIESFSVSKKDTDLIRSFLADCQLKGLGKSATIVTALKEYIARTKGEGGGGGEEGKPEGGDLK